MKMHLPTTAKNVLLLFLALVICVDVAEACVIEIYSFRKLKRQSRAIFAGKVVEKEFVKTENYRSHYRIKFIVEQHWKNAAVKELTLISERHDCAVDFEVGEKYLVYAYYDKENDWLTTSISFGTKHFSKAQEDLIKLGKEK